MSMSQRSFHVKEPTGFVWSERWVIKPCGGGLVMLNISRDCGVSSSSASMVVVVIEVKINSSTSRMNFAIGAALGI